MATPGEHPRILLAEDDDSVRETLVDLLSASGFRVASVHTTHALEREILDSVARQEPFDLLVADLDLPGPSTLESLERLGRTGLRPPTVGVSAFTDDAALIESYRVGCLCVVPAPVDVRELLDVVEMVTRRKN